MNRTTLYLFLGSWFFFTLFHPGRPMTVDGAATLDTVRAMGRGSLAVPESLVTRPGRGGRHYCVYGPLLPLLSLPGYWIGSRMEESPPPPGSRKIGWGDRFALGTNQWVCAILLVLLYQMAISLGCDSRTAIGSSLVAGISTMVWPYSRDYFTQPLAATCLVGFAYSLVRLRAKPDRRSAAWASLAFGMAALARMDMAVCLPGAALWGWGAVRILPREERGSFLIPALTPLFSCLLGIYLFDVYRWDSWTGASYGHRQFNMPLMDSLPRFFVSADLSVFLYNPILLPAIPMFVLTWKTNRWAWLGILMMDLLYLLVVSKFQDFHGGVCPGPRYLLALVPLNLLPLLAGLGEGKISAKTLLICSIPLAVIGGLVNGYSAVVDYTQAPGAWDFWMGQLGF